MHPLGLYLAINDHQRERDRAPDDDRRPTPVVGGAMRPSGTLPEPASRLARRAATLRRRVTPVARA